MLLPTEEGFAIWFTGLPASGKTTLARAVQAELNRQGTAAVVFDSDELRKILTPAASYTAAERDWFYRALGQLAAYLTSQGVNVLIAATANRRRYRDEARAAIGRFAEVYVQCDLNVCRQRDEKGTYAHAAGQPHNAVPGLGAPFEPPLCPELAVDTEQLTPQAAAALVLRWLPQSWNA